MPLNFGAGPVATAPQRQQSQVIQSDGELQAQYAQQLAAMKARQAQNLAAAQAKDETTKAATAAREQELQAAFDAFNQTTVHGNTIGGYSPEALFNYAYKTNLGSGEVAARGVGGTVQGMGNKTWADLQNNIESIVGKDINALLPGAGVGQSLVAPGLAASQRASLSGFQNNFQTQMQQRADAQARAQQAYTQQQGGGYTGGVLTGGNAQSYSNPWGNQISGSGFGGLGGLGGFSNGAPQGQQGTSWGNTAQQGNQGGWGGPFGAKTPWSVS